jgi:hypothetical protein
MFAKGLLLFWQIAEFEYLGFSKSEIQPPVFYIERPSVRSIVPIFLTRDFTSVKLIRRAIHQWSQLAIDIIQNRLRAVYISGSGILGPVREIVAD